MEYSKAFAGPPARFRLWHAIKGDEQNHPGHRLNVHCAGRAWADPCPGAWTRRFLLDRHPEAIVIDLPPWLTSLVGREQQLRPPGPGGLPSGSHPRRLTLQVGRRHAQRLRSFSTVCKSVGSPSSMRCRVVVSMCASSAN